MRNFDLALAILELPQPDPVPLRMSWMRAAAGSQLFTHWFVCRWMKNPSHPASATFNLKSQVQYWSPNAVVPWEWP